MCVGNQKWHAVLQRGHTEGARGRRRRKDGDRVGHKDALESTESAPALRWAKSVSEGHKQSERPPNTRAKAGKSLLRGHLGIYTSPPESDGDIGEVAQLVTCSPYRYEDLCFIHTTCVKEPGTVEFQPGKSGAEDLWGSLARQPSPMSRLQAKERPFL